MLLNLPSSSAKKAPHIVYRRFGQQKIQQQHQHLIHPKFLQHLQQDHGQQNLQGQVILLSRQLQQFPTPLPARLQPPDKNFLYGLVMSHV